MKCPLLGLDMVNRKWAHSAKQTDCLKEECAWWDSEGEHCMIKSIFGELATLSETLAGIEAKMPHEGQFRK